VPTTDEIAADCVLSRWSGDPSACRWCERGLVGRQTEWCSWDCRDRFAVEHSWKAARSAALMRAVWTCQRCWRGPALVALAAWLLPAVGPSGWRSWQTEDPDLAARWWAYTSISPEAHHQMPLFGRSRNGSSCDHHSENVVVLCRDCHIEESRRWAGVRRAFLREFEIDLAALGDDEARTLRVA